jgi:hypothetical protein
MWVRRLSLGALSLLTALGCVEGGEPAFKAYCRTLCELEDTCSSINDLVPTPATLRQCQRECMSDPRVTELRTSVLDVAGACLLDRKCDEDREQVEVPEQTELAPIWRRQDAEAACATRALEEAGPTDECEAYCEEAIAALEECDVEETEATCRARVCRLEPAAFAGDTCMSLAGDDCALLVECVATGLP